MIFSPSKFCLVSCVKQNQQIQNKFPLFPPFSFFLSCSLFYLLFFPQKAVLSFLCELVNRNQRIKNKFPLFPLFPPLFHVLPFSLPFSLFPLFPFPLFFLIFPLPFKKLIFLVGGLREGWQNEKYTPLILSEIICSFFNNY